MSRKSNIKQSEITRALMAVSKAGLEIHSVRVFPDGTIAIKTRHYNATGDFEINPWDNI